MWKVEYRCYLCKKVISYSEKMNSIGRCLHCGEKYEGAGTIVATTEHVYEDVFYGWWFLPWTWLRWGRKYK